MIVKNIFARPSLSHKSILITIELDDLMIDISEYTFELFRSEIKTGPWYFITSSKTLYAEDNTIEDIIQDGTTYVYKIVARNANGTILQDDIITSLNLRPADKYAMTIEYDYAKHLRLLKDNDYRLFKARKIGSYCVCWDDVRKASSDPYCATCGGTGKTEGFYNPVDIKIAQMNPNENEAEIENVLIKTSVDPTAVRAWTTGEYAINTGDILMNVLTNEILSVRNVSSSKKGEYTIRYTMNLSKLPFDHPYYKFTERWCEPR